MVLSLPLFIWRSFPSLRIILVVPLLILNLFWVNVSVAEEGATIDLKLTPTEKAWLAEHPKIRLAVDIDWSPFEFVDKQKQYRGMAAEYIRLVEARLGITFAIDKERPWSKMVEAVKNHDLDAFSLVVRTPQRDEFVNFTKPYISFPMVIVTLEGEPFVDGIEPLKNQTVAVVESYASHDLLVKNHPSLKLLPRENVKKGLEAVSNGQAYAFVGNLAVATQVMREAGISNLQISGQTPYRFELSMAVRKDWPELVPILQKTLDSIASEDRDRIYNNWIRVKFQEEVDYRIVFAVLTVGLLIVLTVLIWNRKLQKEIEHRQKVELALQNSETHIRAILETVADGIITIDDLGIIETINPAAEEIFGFAAEDIIGSNVNGLMPEPYHSKHDGYLARFRESGEGKIIGIGREVVGRRKDGSTFPMEMAVSEMVIGGVLRFTGIVRDITDRKLAEAEMQKLSQAVEQSPATVVITDILGNIEYVNPKFEEITGYSAEEVIGQNPRILKSGDKTKEAYQELWETISSGKEWSGEFRNKRKDGTLYWEAALISPIMSPDGVITNYLAIKEDITENKKAEERIRQSEEQYRRVFEDSGVGMAASDLDGNFIRVNKAFCDMLGYSEKELMSRSGYEFTHKDDIAITIGERERSIAEGRTLDTLEKRFVHKDGAVVWGLVNRSLIKDSDGRPIYFESQIRDITDRKKAEDQLRQAQKMEAVGQLTSGVAHDFNNLLNIMVGNAELLEDEIEGDDARDHVNEIKLAVKRSATLTHRLLAFSRQQTLMPVTTDITKLVKGIDDLLRRTLGETIDLKIELASDLLPVRIDHSQLEHALVNLAVNARDAMPTGGTLMIETANVTLNETFVEQHEKVRPEPCVMVAVSDTGTGMPPEILEKVFEPFFTTKDVGKGSGLGLSMVYGFVKQSDGHITISSEIDHGTTIKLYLPCSEEAIAQKDTKDDNSVFERRSECILVVEDDPHVRKASASILQKQGYEIVEAKDGKEAIDILKNGQPFDLLFTDVVLPGGMNGVEIAEAAKRIQPDIKVLYTSGYAEDAIKHGGKLKPDVNLVSKPYIRADLLERVQFVLENESG